jgi:hypothetical protein
MKKLILPILVVCLMALSAISVLAAVNCADYTDDGQIGCNTAAEYCLWVTDTCTTNAAQCDDKIDNDGDDLIDCQDPDCDCIPPVPEFSAVGVGVASVVVGLVVGWMVAKKK